MFYLFAQIGTESATCEWQFVNLPCQRLDHPTRKLFSTSFDLGSPSSLYDHFRRAMVVVVFFGDAIHSHFPFSSTQLKISGEGNPLKKVSRERVKYFAPTAANDPF